MLLLTFLICFEMPNTKKNSDNTRLNLSYCEQKKIIVRANFKIFFFFIETRSSAHYSIKKIFEQWRVRCVGDTRAPKLYEVKVQMY